MGQVENSRDSVEAVSREEVILLRGPQVEASARVFFCFLEAEGCLAPGRQRLNFSEQTPSSVTVPEAGMTSSSWAPAALHVSLGLGFGDIHACKQARKEGGQGAARAGFPGTCLFLMGWPPASCLAPPSHCLLVCREGVTVTTWVTSVV